MYIKIVTSFSLLVLFFLLFASPSYASDFETDAHVSYLINNEGVTNVHYDITIENTSEKALQKGYDLILSHTTPTDIVVLEDGKTASPEIKGTDDEVHIITRFEKQIAGIKNKKHLSISFATDSIAKQSGDIREILIPKLLRSDNFRTYDVTLSVPNSFGEEAYIFPKARNVSKEEKQKVYIFQKEDITGSGIQATFGKFQVYDINLTYHLKNDSWKFTNQEIALPPDTALQKIYFGELVPQSKSLVTDEDGNWIASFALRPKEAKDVSFKGKVMVFASPRRLLAPGVASLLTNTKETPYWQVHDPEIQELAQKLKTPEAIYKYVVETLNYNYDRARPDVTRLGAKASLQNPDDAICMEFTDLYIALSRAAGIPAREIEGFAQSENPKVQPLSLYADVLHSWPEYWDKDLGTWMSVDPTWEKTTGGQDYFHKLDLKHVAFVIHGVSDAKPYPAGAYKGASEAKKDVYVSLSHLDEVATPTTHITVASKTPIPFHFHTWTATLTNESNVALYNQDLYLFMDDLPAQIGHIDTLLPYQTYTTTFQTPVGIFAQKVPDRLAIAAGNQTIPLREQKFSLILLQLLAILTLLFIIVLVALWLQKHIRKT